MRQTTFRPVIILELNMYDAAAESAAIKSLGLDYVPALGSYKGVVSRSYIVDIGYDGDRYGDIEVSKLNKVLDLANKHNQESVLLLDYKRDAMLIYLNNIEQDVVRIGQLRAVSKEVAEASEAWTFVNNTYYMAV
jgi:hypothetical protein